MTDNVQSENPQKFALTAGHLIGGSIVSTRCAMRICLS